MLPRLLSPGLMLSQILLAGSEAQSLLLSEVSMLFLTKVRRALSCVLPSLMLSRLLFMLCRASLVCLMAVGTQTESEWTTRVPQKKLEMSSDSCKGKWDRTHKRNKCSLPAPSPSLAPHGSLLIKQLSINPGISWEHLEYHYLVNKAV